MKITRRQLRKIISETYRKAQRSSNVQYTSPSKAYAEDLASMLGAELNPKPIAGYQYRMYHMHAEGVQVEISLPGTLSWPYGASIMFENPRHDRLTAARLVFPITGNPEIDAEFINRLVSKPLIQLGNLSDAASGFITARQAAFGPNPSTPPTMKRGSWYKLIMPGYPGAFLQ